MDMAGKNTNIEPQKGGEDPLNYHTPNMSSDWQLSSGNNLTNPSIIGDSFCPPIWDQPINGQNLGYPDLRGGGVFLPQFPADSGFIERAARFSCFGGGGSFGEMMNPFNIHESLNPYNRPVHEPHEVFGGGEMSLAEASKEGRGPPEKKVDSLSGDEAAEFSGRGGGGGGEESSGAGSKKRKRGEKSSENGENNEATQTTSVETVKETEEIKRKGDQNPNSVSKAGGKNVKQGGSQGSDPPKEDYIHIRARRGQATNSHSLAERVRREKISERMKFLQDLVPGCSKVTGKAVMLDEIINYVQSLQRQVEFLSMKLATVNPRLDFNIEGLLAKDILQPRAGISSSSSMSFPADMTMPFLPIHPSQIQACNSSEALRRSINLQPTATVIGGGFKESTSQVPSVWEDELHNVVHMGFNTPLTSQDLSGSLPPGHMKAEP